MKNKKHGLTLNPSATRSTTVYGVIKGDAFITDKNKIYNLDGRKPFILNKPTPKSELLERKQRREALHKKTNYSTLKR